MKWPKLLTNLFNKEAGPPTKLAPEPMPISKPTPLVDEPIVPSVEATAPDTDLESDHTSWKYSEEQKGFIVACIARMMTPTEITEAFKEEFGIDLHRADRMVEKFKRTDKWKGMIAKMRADYLADLAETAGYHKKVRMDQAERMKQRAYKKGDLKTALSALEHQRREVEEKGTAPVSFIFQQYNSMSEEELNERYEKSVKIIERHKKSKEAIDGTSGIQGKTGEPGTV